MAEPLSTAAPTPEASAAGEFDPVAERQVADARERESSRLGSRERTVYFISAGGFVAAAALLALFGHDAPSASPWVVVLLVVSFASAGRLRFESGPGFAVATQMVFVEMWFSLPPAQLPLWAALGALCTELPEYVLGIHPIERGLVPLGSCWFALGPALVFELAGRPSAALDVTTLLVFGGALAAQFALDIATSAARERAALGIRPAELAGGLAWVLAIDLVLAPVGLLAAIGARFDEAALLLPLPLLFMIGLSSRERQRRMDQALELSGAYRGTAFLLGDVVEADDAYTGAHSRDVLDLVLAVCDELQLDARSRLNAEFAALLHDVGKIKVPAEILNKPGPLSPEERVVMNTHTIEGQRLLQRVGGRLAEVGRIVRSCHEDWDGTGYPDGLSGEEIPLVARIVGCCDAFSAMTTNRPYRRARSVAEALAELERCAGTQFDPTVVSVLTRLVRSGRIALDRGGEIVPLARLA